MLDPIDGLTFDPIAHRYRYQGDWLPYSVTGIASPLSAKDRERIWAKKDGPDGWEQRGLAVHSALESHLLGKGVVMENRYAEWIDTLIDHWLFNDCEVIAVEHRLCCPKKRVGGSFDFLLRTSQGTLVLGDLKTVGNVNAAKSRKKADAQLGAYSHMLIDHYGIAVEKCATVVSGPGVVEVKTTDPDECHMAWVDAWDAFQLLQPDW